ncbi:MAG: L-serine ammonia-lyase, iron-sulfur-dependent subunit beta [Lactobacillales bacterium]|jgi:L-serine dehydratase|nr:L-serine ammonia-lyase, iron-sulfur-dependent subunit beta [Lactobacillales bacterium]
MYNARYKSVFDIIGPVMVGPSSSHTAGAAKIGKIVSSLFESDIAKVKITLYRSFAKTYKGHGTDIALVGGLLGMEPDDMRLRDSLEIAHKQGVNVVFKPDFKNQDVHPNTAKIVVENKDGSEKLTVMGVSIGGGNVEISNIDGFNLRLRAATPTYIIVHDDEPGMIAQITTILGLAQINISKIEMNRLEKGGLNTVLMEVDQTEIGNTLALIDSIPKVKIAHFFNI